MASVVAIADDDDASTDADATSVVRAREITSEPSPRNNDDDDAKVISPPLTLATESNDRPTRSARERVAVDKNDDDDDEIGGDLAHRGRDTGPSKVDDDDDPRGQQQRREATTDGIIEEPLRNDRVVRKTARSTATTRIGDATVVDFRFDFRPENEDVRERRATTRIPRCGAKVRRR